MVGEQQPETGVAVVVHVSVAHGTSLAAIHPNPNGPPQPRSGHRSVAYSAGLYTCGTLSVSDV